MQRGARGMAPVWGMPGGAINGARKEIVGAVREPPVQILHGGAIYGARGGNAEMAP
jgi:hypothetical protein